MASPKKPKPAPVSAAASTDTAVAATRRTLERIQSENKALNAFIAITPRNLKDDTQAVSDHVRAAYRQAVGRDAPIGV